MTSRGARPIGRLAVTAWVVPLLVPLLVPVLAAVLGALLAGCAGPATSVQLPPKATAANSTPVSRPRLSPRQQVIAAYRGYTSAMAAAFDSRSAPDVRRLLRHYLDTGAIDSAVRAFSKAWAKDEISYGHVVQHILSVKIRGTAAWVHDCDNTSGSGLKYARTGQVVPGSIGIPDSNVVTRLNRIHGYWQVYIQTVEDVACKA
jgi:hypothetical protein